MDLVVKKNKHGKVIQITILQKEYIKLFMKLLNMEIPKRKIETPLTPKFYFDTGEGHLELNRLEFKTVITKFRSITGVLLYLSTMTRPDIAYAINYLARFAEYPHKKLFQQLYRVANYCYFTRKYEILYSKPYINSNRLICYTDSDYAQDILTRKSINAFITILNGGPTNWGTKYTPLVCKSPTEAALQALILGINEIVWFQELMKFIGDSKNLVIKPFVYVDNQSAIDTVTFAKFSSKSKHYLIRMNIINERFKTLKTFDTSQVESEDQLADIFTKPVNIKVMNYIRNKLLIIN